MRLSNVIAVGALGVGAPLLLAGAGLYSRAECRIDQTAKTVTPIGYKSELQWLFIVAGIGQGALAWKLFQDLREDEPEDEQQSPQALPESTLPLPVFNPPPVTVKAELEPIAPQPAPTYAYQPQPQQATQPQPPSLIKSLAASHLSIVFSAPPGTGKTTTELAWMGHVFHQFPDALMFIACWKNDAFLGLSSLSDAVAVLGDVDEDGNLNWQPLLKQINKVFEVLRYRRNLPKEKRSEFQGKPVWLVLADYYATVNTLSQSKKYLPVWEEVRTKLATIITVGREFQVGACVDTHSFNIASLGISDANIRDCLNICALGKITRTEDGREDGGYGAIAKAIGNKFVVDDEAIRAQLLTKDLPQLQQRSEETGRPVLFTTLGHPPKLVLLPDFRQYETFKLPPHALERIAQNMGVQVEPVRNEKLDLRNQLEMLYQEESSPTDSTPKSFRTDSETTPEIDFDRVLRVREMRNAGLSQTQILAIEWGAKPGDNLPYKTAVAEYKTILKLLEQEDN
ncbi:MAG TPA: hypothetical protein V6C65_19350 [Allocoleopsis sp.]